MLQLFSGAERDKRFHPESGRDLLDGVTPLRHEGAVYTKPIAQEPLYRRYTRVARGTRPKRLTFVPY